MFVPVEIPAILSPEEVHHTCSVLREATWENGANTAGPVAASVKHNLQARDERANIVELRHRVVGLVQAHPLFAAVVRPQTLGVMFSLYKEQAEYGRHVDAAQMSGVRRDVSFTIWLSEPDAYDGGELEIESPFGETRYKLVAGSAIVYPATALHSVTRVTRGARLVIVGWARSFVRDPAQRELLLELDLVKNRLFEQHGKIIEVDLLSKCSANLMRMWMED